MSYIKEEFTAVECDNCHCICGEHDEYQYWMGEDVAKDNAKDSEWHIDDDLHLCTNCYSFDDDDNLVIDESRKNKYPTSLTSNPLLEEITQMTKDKLYGLPLNESWIKETYEQKLNRYNDTESFMTDLISETGDDKLMHTFLRWQKLRNELNEEFVKHIETITTPNK